MRRATHNTDIIEHENQFIGVNLGWDFTAEHEWGIKGIARDYGLRELSNKLFKKVLGIPARTIQMIPEYLVLIKKKDYTYLYSAVSWNKDETLTKKQLDDRIEAWGDNEIVAAWDGKSFGIRVTNKHKEQLEELYEAFQNNNVVITFGGGNNPFSNNGLMLIVADRLPQEYVDAQLAADIDNFDLAAVAEKTGITKRLKNAGLKYFALKPKWAKEIKSTKDGEIKTKHPVIFFLNPMEQRLYNSAWATVEDLDEWIAGKGIIVKEQA